MTGETGERRIKSLQRGHEILELLRLTDGASLSEIANQVDLSVGSVHTYLSTMEEIGYVVRRDGEFELGPRFVALGEYVRNNSRLYRAARNEVNQLAAKTGEAAHLIVEHSGLGIALHERFGAEAVGTKYHRTLRQRPHQHLHCTASGKAILAQLSESRIEEILTNHGLDRRTPNTITDRELLFEQLAAARERGYALNDEEEVLGIVAVGAPVCDSNNTVLGAIAVSGPETYMGQKDVRADVAERVKRSANVCEVNLETEELVIS